MDGDDASTKPAGKAESLAGEVLGTREQRADKRVVVNIPAELDFHGRSVPVRVVDLSAGGALLESPGYAWPAPGSAMQLFLALGGVHLDLFARMVRTLGADRAAVAFGILDASSDRALVRFVNEQEIQSLKAQQHLADD